MDPRVRDEAWRHGVHTIEALSTEAKGLRTWAEDPQPSTMFEKMLPHEEQAGLLAHEAACNRACADVLDLIVRTARPALRRWLTMNSVEDEDVLPDEPPRFQAPLHNVTGIATAH